jgi:hypothetical protein
MLSCLHLPSTCTGKPRMEYLRTGSLRMHESHECPVNPHLMYIWCNIYLFIYLFIPRVTNLGRVTLCDGRVSRAGECVRDTPTPRNVTHRLQRQYSGQRIDAVYLRHVRAEGRGKVAYEAICCCSVLMQLQFMHA